MKKARQIVRSIKTLLLVWGMILGTVVGMSQQLSFLQCSILPNFENDLKVSWLEKHLKAGELEFDTWLILRQANSPLANTQEGYEAFLNALRGNDELLKFFSEDVKRVRAWEALHPRSTSTEIKYLNLFSDDRATAARSVLLDHPTRNFEADFPYLSQEELTAIHLYTTRVYIDLNSALRRPGPLSNFHQAIKDVINEAFDKMPKHVAPYYRGTSVPQSVLDEYLAALPPGSGRTYSDKAFSSSSSIDTWIKPFQNLQKKPGEIKIIITGNSSTGVYIDDISAFGKNFKIPSEAQHEVLFRPGTKFEHFAPPHIFKNEAGETVYHFFMNEKI